MAVKINKAEKSLIVAYVNYLKETINPTVQDAQWIEHDITRLMDMRNMDKRILVEDYITGLLISK